MLKQILSISKVSQLHCCADILAELIDSERLVELAPIFALLMAI